MELQESYVINCDAKISEFWLKKMSCLFCCLLQSLSLSEGKSLEVHALIKSGSCFGVPFTSRLIQLLLFNRVGPFALLHRTKESCLFPNGGVRLGLFCALSSTGLDRVNGDEGGGETTALFDFEKKSGEDSDFLAEMQ